MSVVSAVDDFMIDRVFQPVADWLGRWVTPCEAAEFLLIGNVLARIVTATFSETISWWFVAIVLPIDVGLIFVARYYNRTDRLGMMPRARLTMDWWRLGSLPFAVLSIITIAPHFAVPLVSETARDIANIALCCAVFLMSCRRNPPPPKRETATDLALGGVS